MSLIESNRLLEKLQGRLQKLEEENKLLREDATFRSTFEEAPISMFRATLEGEILTINKKFAVTFGYRGIEQFEALKGEGKTTDIFNKKLFNETLVQIIDSNKPLTFEGKYVRNDGSGFFAKLTVRTVLGHFGKPAYIEGVLEDVTEVRQEAEIREKREKWFRQLFDEAPVIMHISAVDGRIVDVNKQWVKTLGYKIEEIINRNLESFLKSDQSIKTYKDSLKKLKNSGQSTDDVLQVADKKGKLRELKRHAQIIYDPNKNPLILNVLEDVTLIAKTTEALAQSEQLHKSLVESLPDLICISSLQGYFEYMSPQVSESPYFTNQEDIIGTNLLDWLDPDYHEQAKKNISDLIKNVRRPYDEYIVITPTGKRVPVEIRSSVIYDALGRPSKLISIIRDLSKYKEAYFALQESEQRFKLIAENSPDIIWMMNKHAHYTYVSPTIEKIFAEDKDQSNIERLEKLHPAKLLKGQVIEHHLETQSFEKSKKLNLELEQVLGSGERIWIDVVASPIYDDQGKFNGLIGITRDVSDKKDAEKKLKESKELYQLALNQSPEGIFIASNLIIEYVNDAFIKMMGGKQKEDLLGKSLKDIVHPSNHKSLKERIKNVIDNRRGNELKQQKYVNLQGKVIDVEVISSPISFKGMPSGLVFVRNITEKLQAEASLNLERMLLNALMDTIPDGIFFKDVKGRFIKVNNALLKKFGQKDEAKVLGKTDKYYFKPQVAELNMMEDEEIVKTSIPVVGSVRREVLPQNKALWVSVTKMPLVDKKSGEVIGTFGVSRDITKQIEAEQEIRDREERFRFIFDQAPIGMVMTNIKSEILRTNDAFTKMLGYSRSELMHQKLLKLTYKDDLPDSLDFNSKLGRGEINHFTIEKRYMHKNGTPITVLLQVAKIDAIQGRDQLYLGQIIDITDRKMAEDELKVRNNELNNFVYKVSHDLRAPLSSVKGLINLYKIEKDPGLHQVYMEMIEQRIERLDYFIRDILSHSRNLNTDISIAKVDLKALISKCLSNLAFHDNYSRIKKYITATGNVLYSDENRLYEILRNLLSNAVIYSDPTKDSFIKINARISKKKCVITIEDNGIGIAKKYHEKIFDMFFRANERIEGTGIGLYIVNQAVIKLGGSVKLESRVNKGTKFILTLPNKVEG